MHLWCAVEAVVEIMMEKFSLRFSYHTIFYSRPMIFFLTCGLALSVWVL